MKVYCTVVFSWKYDNIIKRYTIKY